MVKPIAKLIVALNTNVGRGQIASGFAWGLLLGLIPAGNFFWIVLFAVSFLFKHHHGSKMFVLAILKILSGAVAPLMDMVGWEILYTAALQPFFTMLYNTPFIVPLTRFNNTLVTGGIASGIILWLPVFFLVFLMIPMYRNTLAPKIRNSKIVKSIKNIPFVSALSRAVSAVTAAADRLG